MSDPATSDTAKAEGEPASSASNSNSVIIIHANGDIAVRLYKETPGGSFIGDDGVTLKAGKLLATFQVSADVLKSNSDFFKQSLSAPWLRPGQLEVDLGETNVAAFEVWLRVLHDTIDNKCYKIHIGDVYEAIELSRKYLLAVEKLTGWFEKWADTNGGKGMSLFTDEELQQVLYPCHELEYPYGFANVTRRLVYEFNGHIVEENPSKHRHLHLHPRIMSALNAARGNLKTQIHKEVYKTRQFLQSGCSCKKEGLFAYELALDRTTVWPLEQVLTGKDQRSVQSVLDGLQTFTYQAPNEACNLCSRDFSEDIVESVYKVQKSFDGLCLDCMDDGLNRDWDIEYQKDNKRQRRSYGRGWYDSWYDDRCRITHDQPTWYFSCIARKQIQDAHQKQRDVRRENDYANKKRKFSLE